MGIMGRKIFLAAAIIYTGVLLCLVWPAGTVADEPGKNAAQNLVKLDGLRPYCGMAIQLQRVDWTDQYEHLIDQVADDGADTVSLVVDARQENFQSNFMYVDVRKAMTDAQLAQIIGHAKAKHMRVILMPIVLIDDPADDAHWRGTLQPKDWDVWFDNYRDLLCHYATLAQGTGVDLLVVGSELNSSEEHVDEWVKTIQAVRDIYKGQLTYSSNWDHYTKVKFWKYLDLVGMNSYWTLGEDHTVSVAEINKNWEKIQHDMFKFLGEVHKPVILLEAGWCSLANAAKDPWDYTQTQLDADNDLQKRLYEGFFESWWGKPQLAGFALWGLDPGGDPTGRGYTPQGKPAEDVARHWLAQPRWAIDLGQ
jgi:hypothetical protein